MSDPIPYLNYILSNPDDILDGDACTQVARNVLNTIGTGETLTGTTTTCEGFLTSLRQQPNEGVFFVKISLGSGLVWQHGIAFQKTTEHCILYQASVKNYSLGQWLNGEQGEAVHRFHLHYSPHVSAGNGRSQDLPDLENLFQVMRNMEFAWNALLQRDSEANFETFLSYQRLLSGGYAEDKASLCRRAGEAISFDWAWRPLRAADTLKG